MPTHVRDLVRHVVDEVAPEELVLLNGLLEFNDDEVGRTLAGAAKRDEPLGFGLETVVALVTPVLWAALSEAARHAFTTAIDSAADKATREVRRFWRRRQSVQSDLTLPPLTDEQITELVSVIREKCVTAGIDPARAAAVADRVAARLALDVLQDEHGEQQPSGEQQEPENPVD